MCNVLIFRTFFYFVYHDFFNFFSFHKVALSITLFSSHKFIVLVINYLQSYSLIISFVSPGDIKGANESSLNRFRFNSIGVAMAL